MISRRLGVLLAVLILASPLRARQEEESPAAGEAASSEQPSTDAPASATETGAEEAEADSADAECHLPPSGDWLDNLRRNVYRSVCGSSLWFDHFFGARRIENERHDTYGWLGGTLYWDEREGFDPRVRFRAKLALPRLSRRLNAVIGREDRDSFLRDESQRPELQIPDPFTDTDEEWLTGLEYQRIRGDRHDLDFGVGVDLGFPMDPYLKVRYRYQDFLGEHWFLRYRLTPFWSNSEQAGGSTRVELDTAISERLLFRIGASALWSQESEGVEWRSGPTLYQRLSDRRAVAWRWVAWGESDSDVPLRAYGPEVVYRQKVWKDWLYLQLEGRVVNRREEPDESRSWEPRFGFGFEMRFGEPDR